MQVINSIYEFKPNQQTYVTIGTFDGVHIGHQRILKDLVKEAKQQEKKSALLTFFPHPRMVLQKDANIKLINTIEERTKQLEQTGLDYLVIHPFDKALASLTAEEFVHKVLVKQFNVAKLIIGYDHHFGKNREGDIRQLTAYSKAYGFEVQEIPAQDIDSVSVSSTKIRKAIECGNIETANTYLGYHFSIYGQVVFGQQLGSKIGFPTANIKVYEDYKIICKTGVYAIKSTFEGKIIYGMMNIGKRPTVDGKTQTIEVHFFDVKANLYEHYLTIEVLHFIREEQKFKSIDELIIQLRKDEVECRRLMNDLPA